ncbi:mitogen-activated protein kinase kinase kinase 13 isoform X1 [Vespula maculifrons]|uniref:Mitogen-activated protein kinase kinase kinase 13 isoform X1 n=1 Tax=Vespula maculifrons TaxID=7453 RepID=A0ABD2D2C5_VESMC
MDRENVCRWDAEKKAIFRMIHEKLSSREEALFVQIFILKLTRSTARSLLLLLLQSIRSVSHRSKFKADVEMADATKKGKDSRIL